MGRRVAARKIDNYEKAMAKAEAEEEERKKQIISETPTGTICQAMQMLINQLRGRGCLIYDFDDKEKSLVQIQIIGGKIYFMAAKGEE